MPTYRVCSDDICEELEAEDEKDACRQFIINHPETIGGDFEVSLKTGPITLK